MVKKTQFYLFLKTNNNQFSCQNFLMAKDSLIRTSGQCEDKITVFTCLNRKNIHYEAVSLPLMYEHMKTKNSNILARNSC